MENVVETIMEIQSRLEREVEWEMTEQRSDAFINAVKMHLNAVNKQLEALKILATTSVED